MKILEFAIKGTEDYSKAQDKEMEDFGKIENLLTDTISNIENGNTGETEEKMLARNIGKYVNYKPQGTTYTVEATYSGTVDIASNDAFYNKDQTFSGDNNLKWQIWKVKDNTLYLISDTVPMTSGYEDNGKINLYGLQLYNNGVTLLDNICMNNYGISTNSSVTARNIKLEDILEVKDDSVESSISGYGDNLYTITNTYDYPIIWYNNERNSLEDALKVSKAYNLVRHDEAKVSVSNQSPFNTYWANLKMDTLSSWKNQTYYDIILKPLISGQN